MTVISKHVLKLLCILSVLWTVFPAQGLATEPPAAGGEKIIRVAAPLQEGFFEVDKDGNYSGYTYEYLMKAAQRKGWRYEFISYESTNENIQDGIRKLQTGELDLMGSMVYSETGSQDYTLTALPYGESNFVLQTVKENETINERTLSDVPMLRVAFIPTAKIQNSLFEQYCKENNLIYEAVYAKNMEACRELVKNGEADVMLNKDVIQNEGFKTILKFGSQAFYFAVTKDNTELAEDLNRIITDINNTNPYFQLELHEKYFTQNMSNTLSLTSDEISFLKNTPPIRTIILDNQAPVGDYNTETGEYSGIIVDILRKMAADSKLPIEFVSAENMQQAKTLLQEGKADMIAWFPYDYFSAEQYDILLTSPIFTMPVVRISNLKNQAKKEELLVSDGIRISDEDKNIKYVEEISEIFEFVNEGEYGSAYVNGYVAQHYTEKKILPNILLTQTPYSNYELCIGVYRNTDLRLMSILEEMIAALKTSDIEDIVYQNTMHARSENFVEMLQRNPAEFLFPVLIIFGIIIALLLILFYKTRRMNKLISKEKVRYQIISTMDHLTQTYNNKTFKQQAREYLSQTCPSPYGALLIFDVDNFKFVNDTYGHMVGDEVLQSLGKLLAKVFQKENLIGRIGGDEFMVLMRETDNPDTVAKKCVEVLSRCLTVTEQYEITLSIGAVLFEGSVPFEDLFQKADNMLYTVKKRGKNGYEIYPEIVTETEPH